MTGYYSRPAAIELVCNRHIEFKVESEAYERRFLLNFNFHQMYLTPKIQLSGSRHGVSILGKNIFYERNVDNAVAIVVGARVAWACEWEGNIFRIRLNAFKHKPLKVRPIISTGDEWVSLEVTRDNAEALFPLALEWLNALDEQQLSKALIAIDSLLSARVPGQNYMLSLFGVFRFWEWADRAKTLSKLPLAKCLQITPNEAQCLVDLRNDLIHGAEFFDVAVEKCNTALRNESEIYTCEYEMGNSAASVLNYVQSLSASALLHMIGYEGKTSKYFPISGTSRQFIEES